MGMKRLILVAVPALAALGAAVWVLFLRPEPEPVYQGRSLSIWVEQASRSDQTDALGREASVAIRQIGTNGIPILLQWLRARDSALFSKLYSLSYKHSFIRPLIIHPQAWYLNEKSGTGFKVLGAVGKDAVPELMAISEENISPDSRFYTFDALGSIGPPAEAAVPLLIQAARDRRIRYAHLGPVRWPAIEALGHIHAKPELAVPALIECLGDQEVQVKCKAVEALGEFGPRARPAVPKLLELVRSSDPLLGGIAEDAIDKIDPEALKSAGLPLGPATAPGK